MRGLLCHALIVTAVLLGGDYGFNGGKETGALLRTLRADFVAQARLQGHNFSQVIGRGTALTSGERR